MSGWVNENFNFSIICGKEFIDILSCFFDLFVFFRKLNAGDYFILWNFQPVFSIKCPFSSCWLPGSSDKYVSFLSLPGVKIGLEVSFPFAKNSSVSTGWVKKFGLGYFTSLISFSAAVSCILFQASCQQYPYNGFLQSCF